jgi:hypothetical protein
MHASTARRRFSAARKAQAELKRRLLCEGKHF